MSELKESFIQFSPIFVLFAFLIVLMTFLPVPKKASAIAQPTKGLRSWQVTCATSATAIVPSTISVAGFMCTQAGTTATYVGGADVNTSTLGQPVCTTNCPTAVISAEAESGYCVVAAATETLTCTGAAR